MKVEQLRSTDGVQNISVRQLMNRTNELPIDTSAPIVTLCASGSRSMKAAHILQQLGYTNVMNLEGGTTGWIKGGFPVVRTAARV